MNSTMMVIAFFLAASVGIALGWRSYRGFLGAAYARLDGVHREVVELEDYVVEYAEEGAGFPVLVSHGIFHGCDGGLVAARELFPESRLISPSRFGYLGTPVPHGASSGAQADAFVALMDHLGLDRVDVVGISAGTGAAVQLALRHPGRVRHLIISSGNWPGSPTALAPPSWARVFYSDLAMWMMATLAPALIRGLMGVPHGFPKTPEQADRIETLQESIFPLAPRVKGAIFDAYVSNPEVQELPLDELSTPALILHAKDDPLASHGAALAAAERIPNAEFASLESGGHLGLGQASRVRAEIADFAAACFEADGR